MVTRVEIIKMAQAICPICFVFGSCDFAYFIPGHHLIKIKTVHGRIKLSAYIQAWVAEVMESGAIFSFAPQFGQK